MKTFQINIQGIVQGVGFRPFIYNLAKKFNLNGEVKNTSSGVEIKLNCKDENELTNFINEIKNSAPLLSHIVNIKYYEIKNQIFSDFIIIKSESKNDITFVSPDAAICLDCEKELFDQNDRRYLYPFINCINCGPRYSIIKQIPYDRCNTTMSIFDMCNSCENESNDMKDRRFHAQPNCCHKCGPSVFTKNNKGLDAIIEAAKQIDDGKIIAVKGLGGYHLICDATNNEAVVNLRNFKKRDFKPFAIMVKDLKTILKYKDSLSEIEKFILTSPQAPITIIKWPNYPLSNLVNPLNDKIGIMLAYTPLHKILLSFTKTDFIIATSGNLKDEPIAISEKEAEETLSFSELFLHHNRPIHNRVDDSVVTIVNNEVYTLRRARGFAPYPIMLNNNLNKVIIGLGAHLKNSISLGVKNYIFPSQYIGDLDNAKSTKFFEETVNKLQKLFDVKYDIAITDLHPDYYTSRYAKEQNKPILKVQHHIAHFFSAMAENGKEDNCIGIIFDGLGLGCDKKAWGGEIFTFNKGRLDRYSHLDYSLQIGDATAKKPYLMMISYLIKYNLLDRYIELLIKQYGIDKKEINFIKNILNHKLNCIETSSIGRLFEAVGSLLSRVKENEFEGHTAILLESFAEKSKTNDYYPLKIKDKRIDFGNLIIYLLEDLSKNERIEDIALKFHNSISKIILDICLKIKLEKSLKDVVFSGGVFQNLILTEKTAELLKQNGFNVFLHKKIPPNDGGISAGQVYYYYIKNIKNLDDKFEKFW
ncbi:carbamoyltransferase HypF [Deferribacter thermophilus]|uniref:carbamoyltransferase HypF n=1 Tax=Deferribacter thermophilus TaxID=53573 RepID=UPI003C29068E